ncbi:hypothetical protein [Oscillatoria sp. FACHB-1406]|uniref:hypothetical protein n=1 Tax=Oscillatoria sp. FACHB-1406 TaxID=2692846 RepID=UPI00168231BF|nr:hypothetical protein [Oscillatoria sp. FACHB-1406]MBD2579716.1 hypothetical protein [Oscillatoria sp. FACHB-1406]
MSQVGATPAARKSKGQTGKPCASVKGLAPCRDNSPFLNTCGSVRLNAFQSFELSSVNL